MDALPWLAALGAASAWLDVEKTGDGARCGPGRAPDDDSERRVRRSEAEQSHFEYLCRQEAGREDGAADL
jgi:hypothetical protein